MNVHRMWFGLAALWAALPETLAEAEQRAASIEAAVRRETSSGVHNLSVVVGREGILLEGSCSTFYCKQLPQQAAMLLSRGDPLTNHIEVYLIADWVSTPDRL